MDEVDKETALRVVRAFKSLITGIPSEEDAELVARIDHSPAIKLDNKLYEVVGAPFGAKEYTAAYVREIDQYVLTRIEFSEL